MNQPRIRLPRYFFIYLFIFFFLKKCLYLPYVHLYTHNLLHYYKARDQASSVELLVNCKTVGFFSEISKEICKAWRTESHVREAREEKNRLSPVSLSVVFGLVPDLLFDCWPVLGYAKIRTVLQSKLLDDLLFILSRCKE